MLLSLLLLASGHVTVELSASALVRGTELALGDVAHVASGDAALAARVSAHSLGYAPAPGYSRLFDARRVQADLVRAFPGTQVALAGAPRVRVEPEVETLPADLFEAEARRLLTEALVGQRAQLRPTGALADLVVPRGDQPAELRARLDAPSLGPGPRNIPIEVLVDGAPYRTVWSTWDVEVIEERLVLVRPVRRGAQLSVADVELREVRAGSASGPALPAAALEGAVALRDLAAGDSVGARDIERRKLIVRGDIVHLEVKKGAVTARMAVRALEDGRIGDRIRVAGVSSAEGAREMFAQVVSRDTVTIRMAGTESLRSIR